MLANFRYIYSIANRVTHLGKIQSHFQALGDGGQGWSNALLYVFFSPTIRSWLIDSYLCVCWTKLRTLYSVLITNETTTLHEAPQETESLKRSRSGGARNYGLVNKCDIQEASNMDEDVGNDSQDSGVDLKKELLEQHAFMRQIT